MKQQFTSKKCNFWYMSWKQSNKGSIGSNDSKFSEYFLKLKFTDLKGPSKTKSFSNTSIQFTSDLQLCTNQINCFISEILQVERESIHIHQTHLDPFETFFEIH